MGCFYSKRGETQVIPGCLEVPQEGDSSGPYRTHVGQVPDLFALQTLDFLTRAKGQEQDCSSAHTESAVPGESCSCPGQRGKVTEATSRQENTQEWSPVTSTTQSQGGLTGSPFNRTS